MLDYEGTLLRTLKVWIYELRPMRAAVVVAGSEI